MLQALWKPFVVLISPTWLHFLVHDKVNLSIVQPWVLHSSPHSVFELFHKATRYDQFKGGYPGKLLNCLRLSIITFVLLSYFSLFMCQRAAAARLTLKNLANANQCFDSLTFHLTAHTLQWRSTALHVSLDMGPLPSGASAPSHPLVSWAEVSFCFRLSPVSHAVRLGSTFHLGGAFCFQLCLFQSFNKRKKKFGWLPRSFVF